MDRRSSSRYALRAPVLFHWQDGEIKHATGVSRDLSPEGAYVRCEKRSDCPKCGSALAVEVLLPSIGQSAQLWKLKAKGFVVRTSRSNQRFGFAVRSQFVVHVDPLEKARREQQTTRKTHAHTAERSGKVA